MHLTHKNWRDAKQEAAKQRLAAHANNVFVTAKATPIPYSRLIELLAKEARCSESTAKRNLAQMMELGIITKDTHCLYGLSN